MTATKIKHCRICGTAFTASRADTTVHCPAHRGRSARAAKACNICDDASGKITYGPSAVDGSFDTVTCHVCGGTGRRIGAADINPNA